MNKYQEVLNKNKDLLQAENERHGNYARLRNEIRKWKSICFLLACLIVFVLVSVSLVLTGKI